MTKITRISLLSSLVILCAIITAWLYYIEAYYEYIDLGWDSRAQINPYLAAEMYLEDTGISVTTRNNLENIGDWPIDRVLYISDSSEVVGPQQIDMLMQWVNGGGHLIISASRQIDNDPLLSHFSITSNDDDLDTMSSVFVDQDSSPVEETTDEIETRSGTEEKADTNAEKETGQCSIAELTELDFEGLEYSVRVSFNTYHGLWHPYFDPDENDIDYVPSSWSGNSQGLQFIQFMPGDGMVSVLSSDFPWQNHSINTFDHAFMLTLLTQGAEEFYILYGSKRSHLFTLIWHYGTEASIAFISLIILSLAYKIPRFGRLTSIDSGQRRSLNEHLRAFADFLWRNNQQLNLLSAVRDNTLDRMILQGLIAHDDSVNDKCQKLAKHFNETEAKIHQLFFSNESLSEIQFLQTIKHLQDLRKTL